MIRTIQILMILLSLNALGQDFDTLSKIQLIDFQDCLSSKNEVTKSADYILSIPINSDQLNRGIISNFLLQWTSICLKNGFKIKEDISETIKLNQNLMSVYLACITRSMPPDLQTKISFDSIELNVIQNYMEYCQIFTPDNKDILMIVESIKNDNNPKSDVRKVKKAPNKTDDNGFKQGLWKEYLPDENFEYALINYVDSIREGEFTAYYKNNALYMRGNYKNGKLHGEHIVYYSDGQIKIKLYYINGIKSGTKYTFTENGSIYSIVNFKDDNLHGPYYKYDNEGDLKWYAVYEDGEEIKVTKIE